MKTDYELAQEDFNSLIKRLPPWALSNFVVWVDLKIAEYKIFGRVLSESEKDEVRAAFSRKWRSSHKDQNITNTNNQLYKSQKSFGNTAQTSCPHPDQISLPQHRPESDSELRKLNASDKQLRISNSSKYHNVSVIETTNFTHPENIHKLGSPGRHLTNVELQHNVNQGTICKVNKCQRGDNIECIDLDSDDDVTNTEQKEHDFSDSSTFGNMNVCRERINIPSTSAAEHELQSIGSLSVIKLELPPTETEEQHTCLESPNCLAEQSQGTTPMIPISSWPPSSTSSMEDIKPDTSLSKETDRSKTGNISGDYHGNSTLDNSNMFLLSNVETQINHSISSDPFFNISYPGDDLKMCNICFGLFDSDAEVKGHFRVDHPESVYLSMCIYCGNTFSADGLLRQHIALSHMGKNGYSCILCGKTFKQSQHFKGHLNSHRGVQEYKCKTCKKSFTYQTHLRCHEKQCGGFTGKYECKICHRQYRLRRHLNEHMRGMHGKSRYTCEFCNNNFVWRGSFIRHKKKCSLNPNSFS